MEITKVIQLINGIEVLSFVGSPATEDNINLCSYEYCGIDHSTQTVKAKIMIPYQKIYREDPERYYYFDKALIKETSFSILNNPPQFSIGHSTEKLNKEDVSIYELYQDNDSGILMVTLKINNEELWQGITSGIYNGISLEAVSKEILVANLPDNNILALEVLQGLESELARELMLDFNNN